MINCKNCKNDFEGNYCPNCGQKVINKRFNLKDSVAWLLNSIFNLDHGFMYTTRELLVNPGFVIRNVLNGVTVRYMHPFRILFVWATISTLFVIFLGTFDEQTAEIIDSMEYSESQRAIQEKTNAVMKKYLNFVIMANVPVIALLSLLFYRKKKYNFTEHMVVNSYGFALTTAVGVIITLLQYIFHSAGVMIWLSMLSNVLIMAYVYKSTFEENYFVSLFKYLLSFLLSYLLVVIFISILIFIAVLLTKTMGLDLFPLPGKAGGESF